jgi:peptide/nickel transport system substrate-binding protein
MRRWSVVAALACAFLAGPVAAQKGFYREAPELAERVAAKTLPPVEERLPRNPVLLPVEDRVGAYGGEWPLAMIGRADGLLVYRTIGYEPLVRWDPAWRRLLPNVAQSYEVNPAATEFVFHLRAGLKWSDGAPYTAEDVRFWFDDVLMSPELIDELPNWLPADRRGVRLAVENPRTVRFVFDKPNSLFLSSLAAGQDDAGPTELPRHALERLLPRHNPNADAEAKAAGFPGWKERFELVSGVHHGRSDAAALLHRRDPAADRVESAEPLPTLNAWSVARREPGAPARYVAVRNPYYFKIDPAGNQLPYIDRVAFLETDSLDQVKDLLRAGIIGMQARHVANATRQADGPALIRAGDYRPVTLMTAVNNVMALAFNQTAADPAKRAVLANRDVRIALSAAIDRQAVIRSVMSGLGEPSQPAPRPESRYYSARLANQHLTFDVDEANRLLDAAGFSERGEDGIRRNKDGVRLAFTVLVRRDRVHQSAIMKLLEKDWRAVGVEATTRDVPRKELAEAVAKGAFDVAPASNDGGLDPLLDLHAYIPLRSESAFGPAWQRWVENPADPQAEVPPDSVQRQIELYRAILATPSAEAQGKLLAEILEIAADEFFTIGIATEPPGIGVAGRAFANVPRVMPDSWLYPTPAPANPAQFFIAPMPSGD